MIDPLPGTNLPYFGQKAIHGLQVRTAQRPRLGMQLNGDFQAAEKRVVLERKRQLVLVLGDIARERHRQIEAQRKLGQAAAGLLERAGAAVEEGPVARRGGRRSDAISVYARDPDGNLIEFMRYGDA